jgi:hypothetical protein
LSMQSAKRFPFFTIEPNIELSMYLTLELKN